MRNLYLVLFLSSTLASAQESLDFNRDVRPVLSTYCWHCHGPDKKNARSQITS